MSKRRAESEGKAEGRAVSPKGERRRAPAGRADGRAASRRRAESKGGTRLSHLDAQGRAQMVDVGEKPVTRRVCVARGEVRMAPATLAHIVEGTAPKGDVLATARLAGIQAAKRTDEWIPLCHSLPLDSVEVDLAADSERSRVTIEARVRAHARTGVEMEALVAVSAAGLAIYDMCKAVDRGMTIESVRLESKSGGKSGEWKRSTAPAGS